MSDPYETEREDATPSSPSPRSGGGGKRFFWILVLILLAFGAGFGWQWWEAQEIQAQLEESEARADSLELRLTFQELGNTLATSVMQATYGNYEPARQAASEFFTGLQQESGRAPAGSGRAIQAILRERDATITALSRSEAESRDVLANLFIRYRNATGIRAPALDTGPATDEPGADEPARGTEPAETDTMGTGAPTGPPGA